MKILRMRVVKGNKKKKMRKMNTKNKRGGKEGERVYEEQ